MSKGEKVTIYFTSENSFMGNVAAVEARLVEHKRVKYAQYESAVSVVFIPRGARNARQIITAYRPYLLIVKGWGHGEVPSPFAPSRTEDGVTVTRSKYSSHDNGWIQDFEAWLAPKLAGMQVVVDYRGVNAYEKVSV